MGTIVIDKDLLLQKLVEYIDLSAMAEKIKACEGKSLYDMPAALSDVITEVIVTVEKIMVDIQEVGHGGEKEDAVVAFLDGVIKLPYWLEPFDDNVIRPIVRSIVATLNKGLQYEWPKKAVPATPKPIETTPVTEDK
jgi:hypothetical protein